MRLVGVQTTLETTAMSAGNNTFDHLTCPTGYAFKVIHAEMDNPDGVARTCGCNVYNSTPVGIRGVLYASIAAGEDEDDFVNAAGTTRTDGAGIWMTAGDILRFNWNAMTGSNNAVSIVAYEVYRV